MLTWDTPVRFVPLIGPKLATLLERLEIYTAGDLLLHLPLRYEDFSLYSTISRLQEGEKVTVKGTVIEAKNEYRRSRFNLQKIKIADDTGEINATWFNQPFLIKTLAVGTRVALAGKVARFGASLQIENPECEILQSGKPLLHTGGLIPVYPETAGISSKRLRSRIRFLLNTELVNEFLPESVLKEHKLLSSAAALNNVHFPVSLNQVSVSRSRLAFDELFILALRSHIQRKAWSSQKTRVPLKVDQTKIQYFLSKLPFTLTNAQQKVLGEIVTDMKKPVPMNRLLEGDVGSGKTVIAAIAIYVAFLNSQKSLLMAPTEILAEQHFKTLQSLLTPLGINIGIQTGSKKNIEMNSPQPSLSAQAGLTKRGSIAPLVKRGLGGVNVLVGTHALLEKKVQLDDVGLVIIDEQHRFGVAQRSLLRDKGEVPHVLTMTATPIPRTMALTVYGDLDLSVIDEMPTGRIPIKTWVVPPVKRNSAYEWIKKQLSDDTGQQAFIICPFIEPSESLTTVKAVTEEYKLLKDEIFPSLKLGLLHGRMNSKEKDRVLEDFRQGKYQLLVATPVVEVGIDIPTATIMVIEASERFGLAQLHQLRGRVGRSNVQSYCLLFTSEGVGNTERLKAMEKTQSGLMLAEMDMKIRGSGQLYGTAQHGRSLLRIAQDADSELYTQAKMAADKYFALDPTLVHAPTLKERVLSGTIGQVAPD